ncbi:MAG: glutathione S-transferase family protein [Parvibaculaceae bacterium]|nr:glutathione S-transferase family protein [Parvibaculaceae bacterium]
MSLTLYGSPLSPFVRKTRVVLAEKGLDYTLDPVNVFAPPPEFLAISPLKRIPVLRDTSVGPDATLPDSSAICAYLEKKQPEPALYPAVPFDYARVLWFEEYADSELASLCGMGVFRPIVVNSLMGNGPDREAADKTMTEKMPRLFDYLNREIGDNAFLVGGRFSVADIAVATHFVNLAHAGYAPDEASYPALRRFLTAIHARPSFASLIADERKMLASLGISYAL